LVLDNFIGISRPGLDPTGFYLNGDGADGWFMGAGNGNLWGNGKQCDDEAGGYEEGDRVGMLLGLGGGWLPAPFQVMARSTAQVMQQVA
jgi:hypothetical protein